jgi:hypothetical protein
MSRGVTVEWRETAEELEHVEEGPRSGPSRPPVVRRGPHLLGAPPGYGW